MLAFCVWPKYNPIQVSAKLILLDQGSYQTLEGEIIDFGDLQNYAIEHTQLYTPENLFKLNQTLINNKSNQASPRQKRSKGKKLCISRYAM